MDLSPENILVTFWCTKKVKLKSYRPFTEEKKNFFFGQKKRKRKIKKKKNKGKRKKEE